MLHIETDQQYATKFCEWLTGRFPASDRTQFDKDTRTIGLVEVTPKDDKSVDVEILTVAAFHHWGVASVEVTIGTNGAKKQKATRDYIWTVFDYVFNFAEKTCLYCTISQENSKSIEVAKMLGLKKRAEIPDFFGEGIAAETWSITKSEWQSGRWADKDAFPINIATNAHKL